MTAKPEPLPCKFLQILRGLSAKPRKYYIGTSGRKQKVAAPQQSARPALPGQARRSCRSVRLTARNVRESIRARHLLVVYVPPIDIALGPVEPPVAPALQVLRQLRAVVAIVDAAVLGTPARGPHHGQSTHYFHPWVPTLCARGPKLTRNYCSRTASCIRLRGLPPRLPASGSQCRPCRRFRPGCRR